MIEERRGQFEAWGPPSEAEYRGNTYIGGGKELFGDGVGVNVYSTPRDSDTGNEMIFYPQSPIFA